jgi:tRNA uridine 5-carboxymethylaminomethyl modification enzyme
MAFLRAFALENNPIVVIGGGHAGIEAALAISKKGLSCTLISLNKSSIGRLSCNPAIGGLAKGHLVKEIDALGGVMGKIADKTTIQNKILNQSKGRAVWSPRSQVDKIQYTKYVQTLISNDANISVVEDEILNLIIKNKLIKGIKLKHKGKFYCSSLIVAGGTFSDGLIHIGSKKFKGGRIGEKHAFGLTSNLKKIGFSIGRLKTGTPPRIHTNSVNWSKLEVAEGQKDPIPFSMYSSEDFAPKNIPCYLAYTTIKSHNIIKKNINLSAMFSGQISGAGPRYCPSVEDKVVRFADKDRHQLFLEPEWEGANQIYINGFATSLPEEVQLSALRAVKGLEKVELIRPGYAIEYDYFPSYQLKASLETKLISNLYFAGQINGTSGYEEAAAQGLIAGINAANRALKKPSLKLSRASSYIGVMIDDLITKYINEPYRMFTSRSENRLSLRADTAHDRLSPIAIENEMLDSNERLVFERYQTNCTILFNYLSVTKIIFNKKKEALSQLIKRPDFNVRTCNNDVCIYLKKFTNVEIFNVETSIKYLGYEKRELERNKKLKKMELFNIPVKLNYNKITNLSNESREKLQIVKPETLGQAGRIDGVRQSDLAVLSIYLTTNFSRETLQP